MNEAVIIWTYKDWPEFIVLEGRRGDRQTYAQERTCTNVSYRLDEARFHCSACGFGCWVKDVADGYDKLPTYCPNCGAKVSGD